MTIELPRKRAMSVGVAVLGAFLVLSAFMGRLPLAFLVFMGVLGVVFVGWGLMRTFARTPRFRADEHGVWFGGGPVIPWSSVKHVFESSLEVKRHQTATISFEFHDRRTLYKTPVENWLAAPFAVGDIDISSPEAERTTVLASRLDAMRQRAAG